MSTRSPAPTAIVAPTAVVGAAALISGGLFAAALGAEAATEGAAAVPMAGIVGVLVAAFAYGWPRLLGLAGRWHVTWLLLLVGFASALAALWTPLPNPLQWLPVTIAVGVLATFVTQLVRGTGTSQRLEATLGSLLGVVVVALGSGWVGVVTTAALAGTPLTVPVAAGAVALGTLGVLWALAQRIPRVGIWGVAALGIGPLLAAGSAAYFVQRLLSA
ncbi:hypothetical protein [Zhihengliuella sp.]|uniref:hypothetical protein n=1 Tax=Zhihengliuella sp. TaxID=1954483 RepID=UPI002810F8A7|nr:hypothetical protein [Zhihengliuella sp.]